MKKSISKDLISILVLINTALVIIGFAVNIYFKGVFEIFKIIKTITIFLSFSYVLLKSNIQFHRILYYPYFFAVIVLGLINVIISNTTQTFTFFSFFILPVFYIGLSILYLIKKYGPGNTLHFIQKSILVVYLFPILSFIISGGKLTESFYGLSEGNNFYSNHYGWSAVICFSILMDDNFVKTKKIIWVTMVVVLISMIIISNNRTSMICLALILLSKYVFIRTFVRNIPIIIGILIILIFQFDNLDFVITKTNNQITSSNIPRIELLKLLYTTFVSKLSTILFGMGLGNYSILKQSTLSLSSFHNTYSDVIFGGGILFAFSFFRCFIIPLFLTIQTKFNFRYICIPLIIIPFFESNLTMGQFIFYPLFTVSLYLTLYRKYEANYSVFQNR